MTLLLAGAIILGTIASSHGQFALDKTSTASLGCREMMVEIRLGADMTEVYANCGYTNKVDTYALRVSIKDGCTAIFQFH